MAEETRKESTPPVSPLKEGKEGTEQIIGRKDVVTGEPRKREHETREEPEIKLEKASVATRSIQERCVNYIDSLRALEAEGKGTPETALEIQIFSRVAEISITEGRVGEDALKDLVAAGMFLEEELKKDLEAREETIRKQDPLAQMELELEAARAQPAKIEQDTREKLIKLLEQNPSITNSGLLQEIRRRDNPDLAQGDLPMAVADILAQASFTTGSAQNEKGVIENTFNQSLSQNQARISDLEARINSLKISEPVQETAVIAQQESKYNAANQEAGKARAIADQLKKETQKLKTVAETAERELEAHKSHGLKKAEEAAKKTVQAYQEAARKRSDVKSKLGEAKKRSDLLTDDYVSKLEESLESLTKDLPPIVKGYREQAGTLEQALRTADEKDKEKIGQKRASALQWVAYHEKRILKASEELQKAKDDKVNLPDKIAELTAELQVAKARVEAARRARSKAEKAAESAKTEEDKALKTRAEDLRNKAEAAEGKAAVAEGQAKDKERERDQAGEEVSRHKNWKKEREAAQKRAESLRGRIQDVQKETDLLIERLVDSRSLLDKKTWALLEKVAGGFKLSKVEQVRLWWKQRRGALAKAETEEAAKREMGALLEELRERPLSALMASYGLEKEREEITQAEEPEAKPEGGEALPAKAVIPEARKKAEEKLKELTAEQKEEIKKEAEAADTDKKRETLAKKLGMSFLEFLIFLGLLVFEVAAGGSSKQQ